MVCTVVGLGSYVIYFQYGNNVDNRMLHNSFWGHHIPRKEYWLCIVGYHGPLTVGYNVRIVKMHILHTIIV